MARSCEICTHHRAYGKRPEARAVLSRHRLRMVLVEDRIFSLCEHHASQLVAAGASTVAAVRALFHEAEGARSLVGRRAPLDRRLFPPRPEGRRATQGRRASDPAV